WFAWCANLLGVAYVLLTTVLFVFPPELPVTGPNMNYCVVAFAVVLIISMVQWFVDGRKNFTGPRVEMEGQVLTAVESPVNVRAASVVQRDLDRLDNTKAAEAERDASRRMPASEFPDKDV
ncbi:hypothetical protein LTR53_019636, partial [Teratosphaeriaceae sp. CCFEE 6253]